MLVQSTEDAYASVIEAAAKPGLADTGIFSARSGKKRTVPALIFEVTKFSPLCGSAQGTATLQVSLVSRSTSDTIDDEAEAEAVTQAEHARRWDAFMEALRAREFKGQTIAGVRFTGRPYMGDADHGRTEDSFWASLLTITAGVAPAV